MSNDVNIRVIEFYTKAREVSEGKLAADEAGKPIYDDWVLYAPVGNANMLAVPARIDHLRRVNRDAARDNPAYGAAVGIWDYVEPRYETWKRGEEMPEDGTPLSAATFLRKEDIEIIKKAGLRTLEEFAELPDSIRDKINMPHMREKATQAKRFIGAKDQNATVAKLTAQDDRIAQLEARLAAALGKDDEDEPPKRKPGRPRKAEAEQEAA